tara:strand:- start:1072 stop:1245 length:174 start_codon:yes stop_codon:yes gene_type:complete
MRENFRQDFDVLSLVSNFMFDLTKAVKDFELDLDDMMQRASEKEESEEKDLLDDLPM